MSFQNIREKVAVARVLWQFIVLRKKWWLAPLFIILFLFATFIVLTESSALAPLIYTLF